MSNYNVTMKHLSILEYLDKIAKTKITEDICINQYHTDKDCEILSAAVKAAYPEKLFTKKKDFLL